MKSIYFLNKKSSILLLLIWFLNDILMKNIYPSVITGKVSDFIGVFLSPFILTSIFYIFFNKFETIIFYLSISIVIIYMVLTNISQYLNDFFHRLMPFGINYKGTSDITDLFSLISIFFSIISYNKISDINKENKKNLVILMSFIVFINSPNEPLGRPDGLIYLLALNGAYEKIILISPSDNEKIEQSHNFRFQYIGKNNENIPPSIDELKKPEDCNEINEDPEITERPLDGFSSNQTVMKFISYRISIFQNSKANEVSNFYQCKEKDCLINLSNLELGKYSWNVGIEYNYIRNCKLYKYIGYPRQEILSFEL